MHSTEAQEKKPFFQRGVQCSVVIVVFTEPKYKHIILILCFEGKKKVFIAVPFCFIHNYLFLRWSCQNFPNYVPGQAQFSWRQVPAWLCTASPQLWEARGHSTSSKEQACLFLVSVSNAFRIHAYQQCVFGKNCLRISYQSHSLSTSLKEKLVFLYCICSHNTEPLYLSVIIETFSKLTIPQN